MIKRPLKSRKPASIIYDVDEMPEKHVLIVISFQHLIMLSGTLIYPVVIANKINASDPVAQAMVSLSMIAAGIGTILLSLKNKYIGAGYLCPQSSSAAFLQPSIMAGTLGQIPMILGMTLLAGLFQAFLSQIFLRLRKIFTTEVSGLVVIMVGVSLVPIATSQFMGVGGTDQTTEVEELIVSFVTLITIVAINIWAKESWKIYSIISGIVAGYISAYILGVFSPDNVRLVNEAPLLAAPGIEHIGWKFDWFLCVPFFIAALSISLKNTGDIIACQKISRTDWVRPDMQSISRGILASSIGTIAAGIFGGIGQATSSGNIGFSAASGTISRSVGFVTGAMLIFLAFFPKLAAMIAYMPRPVMGATLLLMASFVIITGMQVILSRMIDARKTFVIGISIMFGLSVDISPSLYENIHPWLKPIFSSSLSVSTILAILLNSFFRIGIYRRQSLSINITPNIFEQISDYIVNLGAKWGAREEVITNANLAMQEFFDSVLMYDLSLDNFSLHFAFDEHQLIIEILYIGPELEFPKIKPSPEELLKDDNAFLKLSGYMIRQHVEKIKASRKGEYCRIRFEFIH